MSSKRRSLSPEFKAEVANLILAHGRSVSDVCREMQVSHIGFYAWRKLPECARRVQDRKLLTLVRASHRASKRRHGSPRVLGDIVEGGVPVGVHRIARLMREEGLYGRRRRRFRVTTQSKHKPVLRIELGPSRADLP